MNRGISLDTMEAYLALPGLFGGLRKNIALHVYFKNVETMHAGEVSSAAQHIVFESEFLRLAAELAEGVWKGDDLSSTKIQSQWVALSILQHVDRPCVVRYLD
ncbi:hypothetical protein OCU04_012901 [Sclerotinia nivalis]|uniref:Uncharacterized protein n=1 Tax=Sclerotinia nivalis TaxID=352851 RepID=A0A9X0A9I2_9HELO|nr:hypothetical protein OCU04_012901 [Sclerotinia nivalis]